jgi:hypothetical protein
MNVGSREGLVLPIFASTDSDPEIYLTVHELETYAEPVDVKNREWRAYDASGVRLRLTVEDNAVKVASSGDYAPDELAEWLRSSRLLHGRRTGEWLAGAALPELLAAFDIDKTAWREQRPLARFARWLRARRSP